MTGAAPAIPIVNETTPAAVTSRCISVLLGYSLTSTAPMTLDVFGRSKLVRGHNPAMQLRAWLMARRTFGVIAAVVLTAAVVLYAPIGLGTQEPQGMAIRTHIFFAVLAISAVCAWVIAVGPEQSWFRFLAAATAGFNGLWLFSYVGPPVLLASLLTIIVAGTGGVRRSVATIVVVLAVLGFGVAIVVLRLTEPPGEHIFG